MSAKFYNVGGVLVHQTTVKEAPQKLELSNHEDPLLSDGSFELLSIDSEGTAHYMQKLASSDSVP